MSVDHQRQMLPDFKTSLNNWAHILFAFLQLGDPANATLLGLTQIQAQPYQLTVGLNNGTISWTKAKDLPPGKYQLQIMYMDGQVCTSTSVRSISCIKEGVLHPRCK